MARAVLVTGPAGVGKSRLRWELLRRLAERRAKVEVLAARGDAMSAGAPLSLLAGALRRAAGVLDGEPAPVRHKKLAARVGRHVRDDDRARVVAFLAELAGANVDDPGPELRAARADAQVMRDETRRAFIDWLAAECAVQPVVLVLDDLHWGDLPTVKLVDAALRALADRPFMVLALARPDVHETFPGLWSERAVHALSLGELSRRASEKLVRAVLGDTLRSEVVDGVVARAAGNAFYLEELIRAVAEGREGELPATVLAMLQARLERLPQAARRVLRAASVFGEVFWEDGVMALLGGAHGETVGGEWLRLLVEHEIVTRRPGSRFPGQVEYVFRHALVRDAAYGSLTDEDRALGHRLAGEWLERAGEPDPRTLAEHCERGGEPALAVSFYRRAAEVALDGDDLAAALALVERGLNAASVGGASPAAVGALRVLEAEAHRWRSEHAAAERAALEARRCFDPGARAWWDATAELVMAAGRVSNHERLTALADELLALEWPSLPPEAASVAARLASQLLFMPHGGRADALLARVRGLGGLEPGTRARVDEASGFRAYLAGDLSESLRLLSAAGAGFAAAGQRRDAALLGVNLAYLLLDIGEWDRAEATLRGALDTATRLGLPNVEAVAQQNLALALARRAAGGGAAAQGDGAGSDAALGEARRLAEASARAFAQQGDSRMQAVSRAYLADILLRAGDVDAALAEAEVAAALAPAPGARGVAIATRARALLARGRAGDALVAAEEGMALVAAGVDEGEAALRLVHAEALRAAGRAADALAAARAAAAWLEERAARMSKDGDSARLASFLAVPEHTRLFALARGEAV
jgi:tetratricopeptide (TPR) repeat protein